MSLTPEFYGHMLEPLIALASGKVAVVLEGGYCHQSLSDSIAITLRTLLQHPCPPLLEPLQAPCKSIQESILNCIYSHRPYWKCLQSFDTYSQDSKQIDYHQVIQSYRCTDPVPERQATTSFYPTHNKEQAEIVFNRLTWLQESNNFKC